MHKLMTGLLLAASILPAAAQAQSQAEVHRDRREVRQDRREVNRDVRRGDWREAREDRQELREDRRETREDVADRNRRWARDDWRSYRDHNRAAFDGGRWRAPFRYTPFRTGVRIAPAYYNQGYWVREPWRYHLRPVYGAQRWVRHYNDLLLVDTGRGVVLDVIRGFYY